MVELIIREFWLWLGRLALCLIMVLLGSLSLATIIY